MKGMQLQEAKSVAEKPLMLVDTAVPEPTAHQIQIKVSVCGVCHTDLHTVEGELDLPQLPIIPGHQIVGVVNKLGQAATRFKVGDRVGVAWLNWTCGHCGYCQNDQENLCEHARFTGLHMNGGYAQTAVVDERFAYLIPDNFHDEQAAPLLCAGIIGYRSLRLSGIQPGKRLGLYGFGASAHLAIQVAKYWGCEMYVFTRSQAHRDHAEELGAVWTGGAEDSPPQSLDAAITFAPAGWIAREALKDVRPGGTVAINAIHMSPIPEMDYSLIYGERVLRSVANFTRQDAEQFLQLAAEIPVDTAVETYNLDEANQALQKLKASQLRGAAVLRVG